MRDTFSKWWLIPIVVISLALGFIGGCSVASGESDEQSARKQLEKAMSSCIEHGGTPMLALHYSTTVYSMEDCRYPTRSILGGR